MSGNGGDGDLYGDLDTSTSALEKKEALDLKTRAEKENARLRSELALLQTRNTQLGAANQQLETNMSTLFVTAQLELKRKDAEIRRLRDELEAAAPRSRPSADARGASRGRHDERRPQ